MKRFSCVVFVFISFSPLFAQIQGQWVSTGMMQSAREYDAQVRLTNGRVLAIGGVDNSNNLLSSAEIYNPSVGTWALTGSMADPREIFAAVVLTNGKVLVTGGMSTGSTVLASAELYDPVAGTWGSAGSMSVARAAHTATLLQNGKVLVTGGCQTSACSSVTSVSELYDPTSNTWSTTGNLNTARYYQSAVKLKTGKVLVVGGSAGSSCELYDPAKGTWSVAASMSTTRNYSAAALLTDGKVLVTGGTLTRFPISSAEIYDPTANTWTATGSMATGRYAHTATLLPDGTVLVAGGEGQSISCGKACTGYIPTAKAEIYNESKGTFTPTASLPRALAYHSTTLFGPGRALTGGGMGYTATCCVVVNNAEVFTPLTMTFSPSSLNFGLLQTGLTSTPQTVTVTNVSTHSATVSSIASSGDYSESNTCPIAPATLPAGQNCTITVTFKPSAAGTRNGAVTLKDNDPGSPAQSIALTGVGETLTLGFTPASLNLGSVPVGSSSTQSATLTNDGGAAVNITGIAVLPANGTFTQTNNCPATLNVQETCTIQVVFTPPDVFNYKATVSVSNSGGGAASLPVSGTGLDGGQSTQ